jgi:hypothetical protein
MKFLPNRISSMGRWSTAATHDFPTVAKRSGGISMLTVNPRDNGTQSEVQVIFGGSKRSRVAPRLRGLRSGNQPNSFGVLVIDRLN